MDSVNFPAGVDRVTVKTSIKPSKISKLDLIKGNISNATISDGTVSYSVKILDPKKAKIEGGSAAQMNVELVAKIGEEKIYGRVKQIKNMNEAIIYHRMQNSDDPLAKFTPEYFGVFDDKGKPIDLTNELQEHSAKEIIEKYPKAWIMMKDISNNFPEGVKSDSQRDIQDFKFVKDGLVINKEEISAHKHTRRSKLYTKARKSFLSQSGCSFAFQKTTKSKWYTWVAVNIKRLFEIKDTKQQLKNQFNLMDPEQLEANINRLNEFKDAVKESKFTFNDSSLLFVPTVHSDGGGLETSNGVEITLIDLGHGIAHDEGIGHFGVMKQAMADSIQELIDMMQEEYDKKTGISDWPIKNS